MRKRLTSILLAFCLSVSLLANFCVETQAAISEDVYKNYTGRTYYDQEEDCFIYQTEAVLRTTDWYYSTLMLQFSRIREDATEEEIELTIQDKTYQIGP